MYTCPQNHASDAPDFCSVCGVEIPAGPAVQVPALPAIPARSAAGNGEKCPDCETPREHPAQAFCEVCGYNYRTRLSGVPLLANPTPNAAPVAPPVPAEAPAAPQPSPAVRWEVVVKVDPCLYGTPNAAAPTNQPAQSFTLFETENMIGRGGTDIRVHIPIKNDPGVSRRQALLLRQADGSLALRDLGSANGTQLNGTDVVPGVDHPIKDGDQLSIGAWTRILLHAVHP